MNDGSSTVHASFTVTGVADEHRLVRICSALQAVSDPEIPPLSIVDLGMIAAVRLVVDVLYVDITPTFVGCPAVDLIRREILDSLANHGEPTAVVNVVFDPPWTTDRITPAGRDKLLAFGIAPPGDKCQHHDTPRIDHVACPFCNSDQTDLESIFGPTLCRSIHYCRACRQSFEHFKAIG